MLETISLLLFCIIFKYMLDVVTMQCALQFARLALIKSIYLLHDLAWDFAVVKNKKKQTKKKKRTNDILVLDNDYSKSELLKNTMVVYKK